MKKFGIMLAFVAAFGIASVGCQKKPADKPADKGAPAAKEGDKKPAEGDKKPEAEKPAEKK